MSNNDKLSILIFPGGTEIGLEISKSLSIIKNISLFSLSSNVSNHAPYNYKNHFIISDINSKVWLNQLNKIITENNIDLLYPANDLIIDALVENRDKVKVDIILPENNTVRLVRSKKQTYRFFMNKLPVPNVYNYNECKSINNYPIFIKPDKGYGGQGAIKITNYNNLVENLKIVQNPVVMEYLSGTEFTIDCFSSKNDGLLFCSGRERKRVRMGTSMESQLVKNELNILFNKYAEIINNSLNFSGAWFFQMKEDKDGILKLLEIEPRIAGTMALNRVRGINFPLLSIYEILGKEYEILLNSYDVRIDRALNNRYKTNIKYDSVYIDLDHTLIVNGRINKTLISFLFQCINRGKKIVLITKSLSLNLDEELKKYRIYNIFDQIIWLKVEENKHDHIDLANNPIFIDDSFLQRKAVAKELGIHTFDPSFIEVLFDDRI